MARGLKKTGRRIRKGARAVKKFVGGTARKTRKLLHVADKLSGGQASAALASHPYGQAGLVAMNAAAGKK